MPNVNVALIISAVDKMSRVIDQAVNKSIGHLNRIQKKADDISRSAFSFGKDATMIGLAAGASLYKPVQAYAELEDAATSLQVTMMKANGQVSENFVKINGIAIELGNRLPGTTRDFQNMMAMLLRSGVTEEQILNGVGKSAAYLAVLLKLPYEEAAKTAAKLKEATGVANNDMLAFMDTIARVANLGVETGEMQYAFSRSAGALKLMKIQGLEASKGVAAVYAMLIKMGASGETVGTGMTSILNSFFNADKMAAFNSETKKLGITLSFVDQKTGEFKGIGNMIQQLDKLKKLNPQQRATIVQSLLGPGQDASFLNTLIDKGIGGYTEMVNRMKEQANLEQKVNAQLGTLTQMWEAATGTFTNVLAAFGGVMGPELKNITAAFGRLSERIQGFVGTHPRTAKYIFMAVAGFSAVALAAGGMGLAIGGIAKVISLSASGWVTLLKALSAIKYGMFVLRYQIVTSLIPGIISAASATWAFTAALLANPITWIVVGVVALAASVYLLIKNWDKVTAFFKRVWESVKQIFSAAWDWIKTMFLNYTPHGLIIKHWDKIAGMFGRIWDAVRRGVVAAWDRIWGAVKSIASGAWRWLKTMFLNFTPYGLIIKYWEPITGFFGRIWDGVTAKFNQFINWIKGLGGVFLKAGANIVTSLWNGIKSLASKPVEAIKNIVKQIRDFLPFSPAKRGPLMDLHRVKIVETVASAIKPAPMVKAMRATAAAAMVALSATGAVNGANVSNSSIQNKQSSTAAVNITYAPVININGPVTEADKSDFAALLRKHSTELQRIIADAEARKNRKKY